MAEKVYVINDTPLFGVSRKQRRAALRREQSADNVIRPDVPPPTPSGPEAAGDPPVVRRDRPLRRPVDRAGLRLVGSYLLGPLAVARQETARERKVWAGTGVATLLAGILLVLGWSSFAMWAEDTTGGWGVWLIAVATVPIAFFVTWSRALMVLLQRHPAPPLRRLRRRGIAIALGTIAPGLGYHVAGHSRKAARPFTLLGPVLASLAILLNWRWLWELGGSGATRLEVVFVLAAGTLAALLLAWIGFAVHAARLIPSDRRPIRFAPVAVLLLGIGVLLAGTRTVTPLAGSLHRASTSLRADGFRWIPLGLCRAATHLDPARPVYLLDVAALSESLGRAEQARQARRTLAERAVGFHSAMETAARSRAAVVRAETAASPGSEPAWPGLEALSR